MEITDWLFKEIVISRFFQTQIFYIFMFFFTIFALFIAKKSRLFKFSLLLWLGAAIIGLIWEITLFSLGRRQFHFWPPIEIIYHALTEGGPGLIIMTLFAHKIRIIDLSKYKEEEKIRKS